MSDGKAQSPHDTARATQDSAPKASSGVGPIVQRRVQRLQSREIRRLMPSGDAVQQKGDGGDSSAAVHAAASRGVAGGGGPLPHRDAIQRSFGAHDVSNVQAHVGGAAAEASQAMGAQAYATGDKVAFAQAPDLHTAAHEAAHTVQQKQGVSLKGGVGAVGDPYERQADAVADRVVQGKSAEDLLGPVTRGGGAATQHKVQRKSVAEQVTDLLSYGALDWAVTDEEATNALRLLGSLNLAARRTAVTAIGTEMIDRLIDNLPETARRSQAFGDLLIAMGPARVRAHLDELMSYGFFDWAITDAEATEVFRMICLLPGADQTRVVSGMTAEMRARFVDNLPGIVVIDQSQHDALRRFFDATPDAEITTLMKLLALRFNIEVTTLETAQWDRDTLRRSWDVLKMLPPAHVAGNPDLATLLIRPGTGIGGAAGGDGTVYMNTGTQDVNTTTQGGSQVDATDPLRGVNRWDKVVRHEVGHRVDPQVNATDGYCATAKGGTWEYWNSNAGMAQRLVDLSAGAIKSWADGTEKQQIVDALQSTIDAGDFSEAKIDTALQALPFLSDPTGTHATAWASVTSDPVYTELPMMAIGRTPWQTPPAPLGGRIVHKSYDWPQWVAYDPAARTRKVSNYQFRAPMEWFADAYAAYYEPSGGTKGALLVAAGDQDTKDWFDTTVDPQGGAGSVDPTTQTG